MDYIVRLDDIDIIVKIMRTLYIFISTFIIAFKISNKHLELNFKSIILLILLVIFAVVCIEIKKKNRIFLWYYIHNIILRNNVY